MSDAIRAGKDEWIATVLGVVPHRATGTTDVASALAEWRSARAACVASLTALEKAVRRMADPEGNAAIILLRAIRANLTAAPETLRQVAELERYVLYDNIITEAEGRNGFGIKVVLRAPLLSALAALRAAYETAESGA